MGTRMHPEMDPEAPEPALWTRAGLTLLRLALVVFLVWALFSGRFPGDTPVAEDAAAPRSIGQTTTEPTSVDRVHFN